MDRTKVSGTFDVGSIPAGATQKTLSFAYEIGRFLRAAPNRTKKHFQACLRVKNMLAWLIDG